MGYVYLLLAAALWGLLGPVSRFALRDGLDPLEIAFWRAVLATALFAVHTAARREMRIARRDLPAVVGFGVVGVALFYLSYFRAVQLGGAALAAVLLYTAPVWVALLSALFLGERLGPRKAGAMALALAGVAGIALSGGGGVRLTPGALAWGLASGWAYAVYYLFGKRYFTRYHASTLFLYALPVGALVLLPMVEFHAKTPATWVVLVFVAVVPTYASYLLYSVGLQRVEATRAATVSTFEPVVATAVAYTIWGEKLGTAGYLSAALVLFGVVLMVTAGGEGEPPHPPLPGVEEPPPDEPGSSSA
jgi:DME family drug/metabolite transporter